ncbi:hypothetical protein AAGW05_09615 [Arthrobacter sp. LAPM80]|uniref:hypothetical protein n=1 Tax=Arthrobacter sp. LAPM80 TaxID=3141788 RepID=UPI00398B03CF
MTGPVSRQAHGQGTKAGVDADFNIVARLLSSDETAFATVVAAYSPLMLHVVRGFVSTPVCADDPVQDS